LSKRFKATSTHIEGNNRHWKREGKKKKEETSYSDRLEEEMQKKTGVKGGSPRSALKPLVVSVKKRWLSD